MMVLKEKFNILLDLAKVRISVMVLITAYFGYYLGLRSLGSYGADLDSWITLSLLLFGTLLSSSGATILNQYIERDADALMNRTKNRPLPMRKIVPQTALILGIGSAVTGVGILALGVNLLTGFLSLSSVLLYLFFYTPLKKRTKWNTLAGSIPGALPPLGGWTAATGSLDAPGWILFGILFCWQIPHFFAIAVLYADDYKKGGFKTMPSEHPSSNYVSYPILFFTVALLVISIGLFIMKLAGVVYAVGAGLSGLLFLYYGFALQRNYTRENARKLMFASLLYLPILLVLIIVG